MRSRLIVQEIARLELQRAENLACLLLFSIVDVALETYNYRDYTLIARIYCFLSRVWPLDQSFSTGCNFLRYQSSHFGKQKKKEKKIQRNPVNRSCLVDSCLILRAQSRVAE